MLALISGAANEQQVDQKGMAADTTASQPSGQNAPTVVVGVESPPGTVEKPCNPAACDSKPEESWWHKLWTDPVATFTGALFLATAALIVTGVVQWNEMRNTAQRQLRAYVHVYPGFLFEQDERVRAAFEARPEIKNNGQTPAYRVAFRGATRILPIPIPDDFDYPLPPARPGKATLGPGQHFEGHPPIERLYDPSELEAILRGHIGLYTYGTLTYEDAFGRTRQTDFCYAFVWGSRGLPTWFQYGPHNHAT